jgi:hypothetical protein
MSCRFDKIAIGDIVQLAGAWSGWEETPLGIVIAVHPVEGRWPNLRVVTKRGVEIFRRWHKITVGEAR